MSITAASDAIDLSPSSPSLSGLDGINFFLAGMQAGFGPFVAVLLADEKWTQQNIGYVLSVSGIAGLLSQLPGGELLDVSRSKRFLVALGAVMQIAAAGGEEFHRLHQFVIVGVLLQTQRFRPLPSGIERRDGSQPLGDVRIAQSTWPIFQVGFEVKDGIAETQMACVCYLCQPLHQHIRLA